MLPRVIISLLLGVACGRIYGVESDARFRQFDTNADGQLSLQECQAALESSRAAKRAEPLEGQIVVDPVDRRWLRRHGAGPVYICGPGDPEDFLYRGQRNPDGTRSGDQTELMEQLIRFGGNCLYMQAVRTHGGDARGDRTHNPFVDSDPAKGLDDRILAQWEEWFTLMDQHNILIYFFFYDDGARIWDTGDHVGRAEFAFIDSVVRRFQHHKNLIWMVGEESEEAYTADRVQTLAFLIRSADDHDHPVGNHHLSGTRFKAWRADGALSHFAMQLTSSGEAAHAGATLALREAAGRYQVIYAESTATPTDPDGQRRFAWQVAMGGLMPMLLIEDIGETPTETFRQWRVLQRFFESTDFTALAPHDEYRQGGTKYVLADPGRSYIAYADRGRPALGLRDLPTGNCTITWVDCRSGASIEEQQVVERSGDRLFHRPPQIGAEAAAWIRFPDIRPRACAGDQAVADVAVPREPRINQAPLIVDHMLRTTRARPLSVQLIVSDDDGPGPYTYSIVQGPQHGTLTGDNNDRTYTPHEGYAGTDQFIWKVHDGADASAVATVTIRVAPQPGR